MEIFLDDHPRETTFAEDDTLQDVLVLIQANMCTPGDVVIAVRCDGRDIPSTDMADVLQRRVSSVQRLEVFTGTRHQLVLDAMEQASVCLADTDAECQRVAGLLTEGNVVEAAEALGGCLRVWQQIHDAVAKSIEMLQLSAEQTTVHEEPLVSLLSRPKEVLLQVRDALRVSDYVLLADILQYEFHEVTQKWQAIITMLQQKAGQLGADADF